MYIAGVKNREGELILMIMIYRARYDQLGMYYANLFRIICGLIESSFRKAWDYQNAVREKVYIDDTVIASEGVFRQAAEPLPQHAERRHRLLRSDSDQPGRP